LHSGIVAVTTTGQEVLPLALGGFPIDLTIIVPAYNEAETVADTIRSIRSQTFVPRRILVVDDCSTDDTAAIAAAEGADVVTPPKNTGSKAGAQTFALQFVTTEFTMAIDADTILAVDAVEQIMRAICEPNVAAACGFVLPRFVSTIWERGRYAEYLITLGFYKAVQQLYGRPLIASGCFSVYRTNVLRELGGWSTRTLAEDMDLTWTMYRHGYDVRFAKDAKSYPIEPHSLVFLGKQLKRWAHGFMQNVHIHWPHMLPDRGLSLLVTVAMFDAVMAPLLYWIALPALMLFVSPAYAWGYFFDLPIIAVPLLVAGYERSQLTCSLMSLPAFVIMRQLNAYFMLRAFWSEFVLRRSFHHYEKGH
jgi:poly-beta-1,6-N-acetyl-D-glucosamine synthase